MIGRSVAAFAVALLLAPAAYAQEGGLPPLPEPPPEAPPPAEYAPPAEAAPPPAAPKAERAFAFAAKGSMEAEGALGLGYPKGGDFDFLIAPAFRYYVINGLGVGGAMRFGYHAGPGAFVFQFVPGVHYNFNLGSKIFPYVGGGLGFNFVAVSVCVPNPPPLTGETCASGNSTDFLFDIEGGAKFVLAPRMVLGAGLNIPLVFGDGTGYYINVVGSFAYLF